MKQLLLDMLDIKNVLISFAFASCFVILSFQLFPQFFFSNNHEHSNLIITQMAGEASGEYNIRAFGLSFIIGLIIAFFLRLLAKQLESKYQLSQRMKSIDDKVVALAINAKKDESKRKKIILSTFYTILAISLAPNIFLFDLYNRNHLTNRILFTHTIFVGFVLAIVSIMVFLILCRLVYSSYSALLITLFLWFMFWFYGSMHRVTWVITCIGLFCVFMIMFRRYGLLFNKIQAVFNVLAFCICLFFILNFVPAIRNEIVFRDARARRFVAEEGEDVANFYIKREFMVNHNLPSPDIYWFHMDGLMNLNTFERFWDIPQDHVREALLDRGFMLYEDGFLRAGKTEWGLAALLSPALYSNYLSFIFNETYNFFMQPNSPLGQFWIFEEHVRRASQDGVNIFTDIEPYPELLTALLLAGYELKYELHYPPIPDTSRLHAVIHTDDALNRFLRSDLATLLNLVTPLNLPNSVGGQVIELVDNVDNNAPDIERPQLTWRVCMRSHIGMIWRAAGLEAYEYGLHRHDLYPIGFELAITEMFNAIDMILEYNPNAVIILQAEHGFHYATMHRQLLYDGFTNEQVLEMAFSVFSAVRIPPQYGGLDAPLSPQNISRELVNRFVGENYVLLYS